MNDSIDQRPSNRKVFQIQQTQNQSNQYITVDRPHLAFTVCNLLIIGTCIALFAYVNSYFTIKLGNILDGSNIREKTDTFSCDQYFCDRTLYNFMYYYSNYQKCNQIICANQICTTYAPTCLQNTYFPDLNRYFSCHPTCSGAKKDDFPSIIIIAYGLGLAAAVCFGLLILVQLMMGIIFNITAKQITRQQRIALMLSFMWPSFKYYTFRLRNYWQDFDINLKALVIVDYTCAVLLSVTMAIYIFFYIVGTWFDAKQISLFFILLGSYVSYWLMCWSNGRAFWKVKQRFG